MTNETPDSADATAGPEHLAGEVVAPRYDSQPVDGAQAIIANFSPAEIVKAAELIPTKGLKATVGAVLAGLVGLASPLLSELADSKTDWTAPGSYIVPIVAGLVGAGLVGGGVYIPTNKAKASA